MTAGPGVLHLVQAYRNDSEQPNLIWALDRDKNPCRLATDPGTVRRMEESKLYAAIGNYCGLIHGRVTNGTDGLIIAHAMFQGLKRPCLEIGRDDEICVYVLDPEFSYMYRPSAKFDGTGPTREPKPTGSLFVAYADLSKGHYLNAAGKQIEVDGTIRFWEWLLADTNQPQFPADYVNRYTRQVW